MLVASYLLGNDLAQADARFDALARTYDVASKRVLTATEVGPGWRCWDVGGGDGRIGAWLAERVGADGSVLVTDIDPRWLRDIEDLPNVVSRRHDVVRDELPDGKFDLIHARLVLLHLPERHLVLDRLIGCLAPGGYLVVEDFDCERAPVLAAPRGSALVFEAVIGAFHGLLRERGADPAWGRSLATALGDHGLSRIVTDIFSVTWTGGSPGIDLHRVNVEQLADQLRASGISGRQLAEFRALLDDPAFAVRSYPLVSATGRRA
ncbi:class I SAM-dependent methyltransferase [Saccharothrix luteola]|uniref:class I SAM-dependent methyltransferase n=1 Tax=Saccharothrix luteola TaxID=2893018 RepID=UPI001E462C43|nr:methyltransferase [Saccharothrix luteola]MCC8243057.1 methyltransferase domain-containing protein [Saccharothrix luteola]